jgi:NADH dehydrogenase [ubiquinone] 1 alpha subcomplex assembly factor 7
MEVSKLVKAGDLISVSQFMSQVLKQYYAQQNAFGSGGDFITAPEISQVFGEMVGVWAASVWLKMGCPNNIAIIEIGGGRGTLMMDFLRSTKHVNGFHDAIEIHMVENSPKLTKEQQQNLKSSHKNISWHDNINDLPQKTSFFIANEFFDALPINQYIKTKDGWCERMIGVDENGDLAFFISPVVEFSDVLVKQHPNAHLGGFIEVSQTSVAIMRDIASNIKKFGGASLIIDYGYDYYGYKDTLQAVKDHKFHNVLSDLTKADITAHVDFLSLAQTAKEQGLKSLSIMTQRDFLISMGAEIRRDVLVKNSIDKKTADEILVSVDRLISTKQMGVLFKVLSIQN